MYKRFILSLFCTIVTGTMIAQTEATDSIMTQELDGVVVEAKNQRTSSKSSRFITETCVSLSSQAIMEIYTFVYGIHYSWIVILPNF